MTVHDLHPEAAQGQLEALRCYTAIATVLDAVTTGRWLLDARLSASLVELARKAERHVQVAEAVQRPPMDAARGRIEELVEEATALLAPIRDGAKPLRGCTVDMAHQYLTEAVELLSQWSTDEWWWGSVS